MRWKLLPLGEKLRCEKTNGLTGGVLPHASEGITVFVGVGSTGKMGTQGGGSEEEPTTYKGHPTADYGINGGAKKVAEGKKIKKRKQIGPASKLVGKRFLLKRKQLFRTTAENLRTCKKKRGESRDSG